MPQPIKKFIITGHLQLAGIQNASATGQIRVTIPADSQQEAEQKFKQFMLNKSQPVVNTCREATVSDELQDIFNNFFKNL